MGQDRQPCAVGLCDGLRLLCDAAQTRGLAQEGLTLRIGKTALHAYGTEYKEFVRCQEETGAWASEWMKGNGLEEEAERHNVLFQMITTLAFKSMQAQMLRDGGEIDPKDLQMMKDIMSSSGSREKLMADERARIARGLRVKATEVRGRLGYSEPDGG